MKTCSEIKRGLEILRSQPVDISHKNTGVSSIQGRQIVRPRPQAAAKQPGSCGFVNHALVLRVRGSDSFPFLKRRFRCPDSILGWSPLLHSRALGPLVGPSSARLETLSLPTRFLRSARARALKPTGSKRDSADCRCLKVLTAHFVAVELAYCILCTLCTDRNRMTQDVPSSYANASRFSRSYSVISCPSPAYRPAWENVYAGACHEGFASEVRKRPSRPSNTASACQLRLPASDRGFRT